MGGQPDSGRGGALDPRGELGHSLGKLVLYALSMVLPWRVGIIECKSCRALDVRIARVSGHSVGIYIGHPHDELTR